MTQATPSIRCEWQWSIYLTCGPYISSHAGHAHGCASWCCLRPDEEWLTSSCPSFQTIPDHHAIPQSSRHQDHWTWLKVVSPSLNPQAIHTTGWGRACMRGQAPSVAIMIGRDVVFSGATAFSHLILMPMASIKAVESSNQLGQSYFDQAYLPRY